MIRTGIDLVSISRIQKAFEENPKSFFERICTQNEKAYLQNHNRKIQKLAGIFALKEAFSKALGTGLGDLLGFHDVEVSYSTKGQPQLTYVGKKFSKQNAQWQISCSLSHEGDTVAAIVILSGEIN